LRHHLSIAHGSLCEVETLLVVAGDIGPIDGDAQNRLLAQAEEVGRLIRGFIRSLNAKGTASV